MFDCAPLKELDSPFPRESNGGGNSPATDGTLNDINASFSFHDDCRVDTAPKLTVEVVRAGLNMWSGALFDCMPAFMQEALLHSRGSDNSFPVSQAETEKLLAHFVDIELQHRVQRGTYRGSFSAICSYIGKAQCSYLCSIT